MDTIWNICQAIGVGAAAGLSPLVALAAVVVCVAASLGLDTSNKDYDFLAGAAAVIVAIVVLLQSLALIVVPGGMLTRVSADRPRIMPIHLGVAIVLGALGGAIVFGTQNDAAWIGAVFGGLPAALVAFSSGRLLKGVGERLARGEQRQLKGASRDEAKAAKADAEASLRVLAFGVDIVTMIAVVIPLLLPPAGLILPIVAIALIIGGRRREAKKHEGLRVLS
ncbi:MAG: hypothetical protein JHC98_03425 [Thermoleophilaceae bacterium]|nr:hypothetical protein [Thermoleophilaceae bacterium]